MGVPGSAGNISTNGTITAVGHLNCKAGSFTGTNGKPVAPTVAGVHIGLDTSTGGSIEICIGTVQYIDFTIPTTSTPTYGFRGILIYSNTDSSFAWHVGGSSTAKMTLNGT